MGKSPIKFHKNDWAYSGGPMKEGKGSHKIVLHERMKSMPMIPLERLVGTKKGYLVHSKL